MLLLLHFVFNKCRVNDKMEVKKPRRFLSEMAVCQENGTNNDKTLRVYG